MSERVRITTPMITAAWNVVERHWPKKIVRDLKTAVQPSADGGKECEHDYEAHDDKGWECKKCGHQT